MFVVTNLHTVNSSYRAYKLSHTHSHGLLHFSLSFSLSLTHTHTHTHTHTLGYSQCPSFHSSTEAFRYQHGERSPSVDTTVLTTVAVLLEIHLIAFRTTCIVLWPVVSVVVALQ